MSPDPIICPFCGTVSDPLAQRGAVALCRSCAGSVVVGDDGAARKALVEDVLALSATDRADLQTIRGGVVRAKR